jgi:c-di-GMP-binding flagellar brake protein YcgR
MPNAERRHIARIQLDAPITTKISTWRVTLLDLSLDGARVEHNVPLARGRQLTLHLEQQQRHIEISCEVRRCNLVQRGGTVEYCSGLHFVAIPPESMVVLREIIAETVRRDFQARRHMLTIKKKE